MDEIEILNKEDVHWSEAEEDERKINNLIWEERHRAEVRLANYMAIIGFGCGALLQWTKIPVFWICVPLVLYGVYKTSGGHVNPYEKKEYCPKFYAKQGHLNLAQAAAKNSYGIDDPIQFKRG